MLSPKGIVDVMAASAIATSSKPVRRAKKHMVLDKQNARSLAATGREAPPIERRSAARPGRASPRREEINTHGSLGRLAHGLDHFVPRLDVIQLRL